MREKVVLEQNIILELSVVRLGEDLSVTISGGDRPHIGSVALAVPRESLTGDGSISSTVSVINVVGHKDDVICTEVAGLVASAANCVVTVSCGIHFDGISPEQMRILAASPPKLAQLIIARQMM